MIKISTPLDIKISDDLNIGDKVYLTGEIITGRDQAHKKMYETILNGEKTPFEIDGWTIYYTGPCPSKPGEIIG